MATTNRTGFAYALTEGALSGSAGYGGLGAVIKDRARQRLLSLSSPARAQSRAGIRLAAIAHTLRACRNLGLRRVVVYCHDQSIVDQLNRRVPTQAETRAGCLEVRALMNMFAKAEVRALPWVANLEATWLAQQAVERPPAHVSRKLQPSLPLDAA
jgi:ribonuclease HI